ncbi:cupin domain-containing protein [Pseudoduganella eburnea]|uniref:Cupin domain-containing protein n=1 Tax=Massilia eburnea TaxID=1776165 RepID=A0A6L6QNL3_9BURK|nr:cupin domain-containing protein [Massilia eburnea]MTW13133.1 cupin domain-containing protein [Massilia eburnea]
MKTFASVAAAFAIFAAQPAFALDQSASVKVSKLMQTTSSWNGAALAYPAGQAEVTALLIEIAPGGETGWHLHPVASFGYILEGELEVSLKDGSVKHMAAGQALAEVVNTLHNGRNVGKGPVKLVVFYAGASGSTLTVKE